MIQPNNYNPSLSPNQQNVYPGMNNQQGMYPQQNMNQQAGMYPQQNMNQQAGMYPQPDQLPPNQQQFNNQPMKNAPVYNTIPHIFPYHPMVVPCGNCGYNGQTLYREEMSGVGILVMILILILLFPISLFMFCCCWPCLTNPFKEGIHCCNKCGARIGTTP